MRAGTPARRSCRRRQLVAARRGRGAGTAARASTRACSTAGDLFVGLRGERADGGEHAAEALARGGLGGAGSAASTRRPPSRPARGRRVLSHPDPLAGLQALARAWRRELRASGTRVVAITGSTGKTSTKDILAALLSAAAAHGVEPGELQHRDRSAAGRARRAARHRGAGARDGDARCRPDRRADRDRAARCRA